MESKRIRALYTSHLEKFRTELEILRINLILHNNSEVNFDHIDHIQYVRGRINLLNIYLDGTLPGITELERRVLESMADFNPDNVSGDLYAICKNICKSYRDPILDEAIDIEVKLYYREEQTTKLSKN